MGVFLGLVFGTHCHQSGLDIGFGRIVPHGLAQGCLCLGLLRNKPATKAGTTMGPPRGGTPGPREPGTTPGAPKPPRRPPLRARRAPAITASRADSMALFFSEMAAHAAAFVTTSCSRNVLSSPAGRNFPSRRQQARRGLIRHQPAPAGWHIPQHGACRDQYAGQNDPEAMVCLRFTLRTSLPS